jgi:hypothetical protein
MAKFNFKNHIDSFIAALVAFVLVILFTQHGGIGISPDSIVYTSVARNLLAGNGFTDYSETSMVIFPLFYPSFLALVMFITRTDIIVLAPYLNGLMFATVIFLSGMIMEKFKYKTRWYKRLMLAIIALSPSLLEIYSMLWSETLFILLTLIFIIYFHKYLLSHLIGNLLVVAIIAAMAFDTRYAGITLIGTGSMIIFFDKNLRWKKKAVHILIFGVVGISLVVLNLLRNSLVTGLATGLRQKGITPLLKNVEFSGNVLSNWFSVGYNNSVFFEILAVSVMILFIFYFYKNINHWKAYYTYENIGVAFFIVYVLFIVISSTLSRYEQINNRLLAPAFLPLLWISTCQIPKWRKSLPHRKLNIIFLVFTLGIGGLLIGSYFAINQDNLSYMQETGIPGYSEDTWQKAHIVTFLQKHPEIFERDSVIYSNHNQAVYFMTGNSVEVIPERAYKHYVKEFMDYDSCLLIWFNLDLNPDLLTLKEIRKAKKMTQLYSFPDGAIFELKNR